jgi:hypothetical protein
MMQGANQPVFGHEDYEDTRTQNQPAGYNVMTNVKTLLAGALGFLLASFCSASGLDALVVEGHVLHATLKTRQLENSHRHLAPKMLPLGNPHLSNDDEFVETIARAGSQGRLGRQGIRSALYAVYVAERELGFYGLEAASIAEANQREKALRKIWTKNVSLVRARIHREGLVLVVVWTDGVSPECWEAVNARVAERLVVRGPWKVE